MGYKLSEITNEQFKMLAQGKEYSVKMNSPNSWYVSVKEGEWGDVVNSAILEEIRERIEYVYGEVGYITGIE